MAQGQAARRVLEGDRVGDATEQLGELVGGAGDPLHEDDGLLRLDVAEHVEVAAQHGERAAQLVGGDAQEVLRRLGPALQRAQLHRPGQRRLDALDETRGPAQRGVAEGVWLGAQRVDQPEGAAGRGEWQEQRRAGNGQCGHRGAPLVGIDRTLPHRLDAVHDLGQDSPGAADVEAARRGAARAGDQLETPADGVQPDPGAVGPDQPAQRRRGDVQRLLRRPAALDGAGDRGDRLVDDRLVGGQRVADGGARGDLGETQPVVGVAGLARRRAAVEQRADQDVASGVEAVEQHAGVVTLLDHLGGDGAQQRLGLTQRLRSPGHMAQQDLQKGVGPLPRQGKVPAGPPRRSSPRVRWLRTAPRCSPLQWLHSPFTMSTDPTDVVSRLERPREDHFLRVQTGV